MDSGSMNFFSSDRSIDRSEEKKFIDPLSIDDLLDRSSRDRPDVAR